MAFDAAFMEAKLHPDMQAVVDEVAQLRAENERLTLDTTWQDHADHWQKRAVKAEARVAELEEKQADYEEAYRRTINGECAPDEKHCACVPHLRARVAELEAERNLLPNMPINGAMRWEWERIMLRPFTIASEEAFRAMLRAALDKQPYLPTNPKETLMTEEVICPKCHRTWDYYGCEQHACIELFGECIVCRRDRMSWGDLAAVTAKSRVMKDRAKPRGMESTGVWIDEHPEAAMKMKEVPLDDLKALYGAPPHSPLTRHKANDLNEQVEIVPVGKRGVGGAHNEYHVRMKAGFYTIPFMHGFHDEPNGLSHEILLAILIDRLEGFQSGPYACRENAKALGKLEEAIMWLQLRTRDRQIRGVENTAEK